MRRIQVLRASPNQSPPQRPLPGSHLVESEMVHLALKVQNINNKPGLTLMMKAGGSGTTTSGTTTEELF